MEYGDNLLSDHEKSCMKKNLILAEYGVRKPHDSRCSFSTMVKQANDGLLQANDGKMLVNDGEMII